MHPIPERSPYYWLGMMWGRYNHAPINSKRRNIPKPLNRAQRINRYCATLLPSEAAYVRDYAAHPERATMHDNWLASTLTEKRRAELRARVDRILKNS